MKIMFPVLTVIFSLFLGIQSLPVNRTADGIYGVDVSSYISESTFSCLINNGFDFAIIRAYRSICKIHLLRFLKIMCNCIAPGSPDPNASGTIKNAQAAGMKYVDVYIFPSPKCSKSAAEQVEDMGKQRERELYSRSHDSFVMVKYHYRQLTVYFVHNSQFTC